MKVTAFTKFHEAMGAKMVEFAGFNMPIQYEGLVKEHMTVREGVGVFDVSHMGEVWVKGPKAENFVQWITSNDVTALTDGKVQYSCFPNGKGGIVDDLLLHTVAAIAGGGIFGDHASPVSDTSILASTGAGSDHMDHVITQLPYALTVALITTIIYILI